MKCHRYRIRREPVSTVLLVFSLCLSSPQASACTCARDREVGFVGHEISRLPANAAGIAWYVPKRTIDRGGEPVSGDRFTLEMFEGGTFYELAFRVRQTESFSTPSGDFLIYLIAPGEGLTPGATYRVTDSLATMLRGKRVERRMIVTIDSEISEAWITSRLPPGAHAWRDQLLYRTIVDGDPWQPTSSVCSRVEPGRSWDDVGTDRVFTSCRTHDNRGHDETPAPTQSRRTVVMEAYLPGTDIVLTTPLQYVDLDCSGFG